MIDIYNFELELIYSFNLDYRFWNYDIMLNNYEIVLFNLHGYNGISLSCFNYKNTSFRQEHVHLYTYSCLNKSLKPSVPNFSPFQEISDSPSLKLQHLNDHFLYLIYRRPGARMSTLLIFDRVKYENLFKFDNYSTNCRVVTYNSEIGLIGDDSDSEFIAYKIKPDKSYIETVCKNNKILSGYKTFVAPYNKQIFTEHSFFIFHRSPIEFRLGDRSIEFYEC